MTAGHGGGHTGSVNPCDRADLRRRLDQVPACADAPPMAWLPFLKLATRITHMSGVWWWIQMRRTNPKPLVLIIKVAGTSG